MHDPHRSIRNIYHTATAMTNPRTQPEAILHYCWMHKLLPLSGMHTTDGRTVEVLDAGLYNRDAGPDFFNAKVVVDGTLWVGNVEIHDRSSDWQVHGHHLDAAYDNVVLHVARVVDAEVFTHEGTCLPQVQLDAPVSVQRNYRELLSEARFPPCHRIIPRLPRIMVRSWMSALQVERLERKTDDLLRRVERCDGDWEWAYFVTLARCFGFGVNGDAFEQWALSFPLRHADHHRDDALQVEALFMGQAGLLQPEALSARHREAALSDPHYQRLLEEYVFLSHKFSLHSIDASLWRFLRLRPQSFPHIRISQLARLYGSRRSQLSLLLEAESLADVSALLSTEVSTYWRTHYAFGMEGGRSSKHLSPSSIQSIIINGVVPMLFAYGRHRGSDTLMDRALQLLEQLHAERNHIVSLWQECGLAVESAGDSQALIQLKREYCDKRNCLRCRIGYEYLKKG